MNIEKKSLKKRNLSLLLAMIILVSSIITFILLIFIKDGESETGSLRIAKEGKINIGENWKKDDFYDFKISILVFRPEPGAEEKIKKGDFFSWNFLSYFNLIEFYEGGEMCGKIRLSTSLQNVRFEGDVAKCFKIIMEYGKIRENVALIDIYFRPKI